MLRSSPLIRSRGLCLRPFAPSSAETGGNLRAKRSRPPKCAWRFAGGRNLPAAGVPDVTFRKSKRRVRLSGDRHLARQFVLLPPSP